MYCIFAAVFFAVGILGSLLLGDAGVLTEYSRIACEEQADAGVSWPDEGKGHETKAPAVKGLPDGTAGSITAFQMLQEFDDFLITSDTGGAGQNILHGARAVNLLLFAETVRQLFWGLAGQRRLWTGEKRIRRFHVVQFIHQTDGKKRACFV